MKKPPPLEMDLEKLLALSPVHIYWLDRNNVYQGCNDLQAKSAGLASKFDIVGKKNADLPWNKNSAALAQQLDQANLEVMESGIPKTIVEPATFRNGTTGVYLSQKLPIKDKEGNVIGLFGISTDITSLKVQKFKIEEKSAIKTMPARGKSKNKIRILLVDDDNFVAEITKNILEKLECAVDIASSGEKAISLARTNHYDMFFMDVGLPDINGYETARRIHQYEKTAQKNLTPIIALTAHAGADNTHACIEAGMNAVLTKPLRRNKALDVLNAFLPCRIKAEKFLKTTEKNTTNSAEVTGQIINLVSLKTDFEDKAIRSIFKLALKYLPDHEEQLHTAYNEKNWKLLQSIVHKTRGTAAYCRAERLQEICGTLDNYLLKKKKELKILTKLFNQVLKEIETFKKQAENF